MKGVDPLRDDAGVRLRRPRLRRGLSQTVLADLACVSPSFVSMVENGQRPLRRASHLLALADVLRVSPLYLADGREDPAVPARRVPPGYVPFPASVRSPQARPPPAASPPVHPARPPGRPRRRGLAAPTGPRASGQPVAADRPAHHPASTPAQTHRQAACTPGWITMTTTQSPPHAAQRWTTVLDGHQLRRLRQQRGLSQERLASQAGISLTAVTRLERKPCAPCRCRTLGRLAAALGVPATRHAYPLRAGLSLRFRAARTVFQRAAPARLPARSGQAGPLAQPGRVGHHASSAACLCRRVRSRRMRAGGSICRGRAADKSRSGEIQRHPAEAILTDGDHTRAFSPTCHPEYALLVGQEAATLPALAAP